MKQIVNSFTFILLSSLMAFAGDISFTGFGSTGIISYERNIIKGISQELFYEAKLQAKIELTK